MKELRHKVEEKFTGEDPIEIFSFLRTFKEGADHMDISEGAAARILPYFLDGSAREEYKSHSEPGKLRFGTVSVYDTVPPLQVCCGRSPG
jgi:hypothetical protein